MFCFRGFKVPTFVDTVGFSPFIFIIKQQQTKNIVHMFSQSRVILFHQLKDGQHFATLYNSEATGSKQSHGAESVMRLNPFYAICYLLDLCEFIGPKILNPSTPFAHSVPECSWRQSENRITSLEDADEASLAASLVMTPVHAGSRAHLSVLGSDLSNQRSWQSVAPQPLYSAGAEWGRRERSDKEECRWLITLMCVGCPYFLLLSIIWLT